MSEHIISSKLYIGIWAALMCLTVVTASVAFIDLGPLNTVVALVIATLKALLVVLFFMHVKYASEKLTKTVIIAAMFWLVILLLLSLADYSTRGIIHAGTP
ncbi:MAG: cytochrome C oxidase subunit IV family protein [Acidobacteriaceae bacterium]|nr:cytochrome C oxidase subunit IV family protein [Acidobacteriaceae bacterium]